MRGRSGSTISSQPALSERLQPHQEKRKSVLDVSEKPFPFALLPKKSTKLIAK
jgi:hypothetical protein